MATETAQLTSEELQKIDTADDLKISPFRTDGITYGTPTWIWEVVVNGSLYVRAYNGQQSRWYQSAIHQKRGRIHAAGMVREVMFEPVQDVETQELIDGAYRKKYSSSPYLSPMIGSKAKSATIKIIPEDRS